MNESWKERFDFYFDQHLERGERVSRPYDGGQTER